MWEVGGKVECCSTYHNSWKTDDHPQIEIDRRLDAGLERKLAELERLDFEQAHGQLLGLGGMLVDHIADAYSDTVKWMGWEEGMNYSVKSRTACANR